MTDKLEILGHSCPEYDVVVQKGRYFGYSEAICREIYWVDNSKPTPRDHPNLVRADAHWTAGNDEYGTPVRYCPWCALDLWTLKKPANVDVEITDDAWPAW